MPYIFSEFPLNNKKTDELEKYEKEYLSRLKDKKKTKSVQKKPAVKKTKKKTSKKSAVTKTKKTRKTPEKKKKMYDDDTGIVLIEDDLEIDEQMELEERKAYLEEARSQESSD